jgi:anti-sigma factor RsiW
MKCTHAKKLISGYLDRELGADEAAAIAAHIEGCKACGREVAEYDALRRIFASAERFDAPYGLGTRVMSMLKEPEKSGLWRIFSLQPLFLRIAEVAFALLIMTMGVISGSLLVTDKTMVTAKAGIREVFSLDLFEAAPPGSVSGIYVAMTGGGREK